MASFVAQYDYPRFPPPGGVVLKWWGKKCTPKRGIFAVLRLYLVKDSQYRKHRLNKSYRASNSALNETRRIFFGAPVPILVLIKVGQILHMMRPKVNFLDHPFP